MLTVLPVVKVEGQLGCSCPHSQLRVMEVVLETAPRMGLGVPPPVPQSDLHGHCSGGEGSRAATMALIQAMLCLGAVDLQTAPLGRSISPDLCHSQELSGFVGDCGRGRDVSVGIATLAAPLKEWLETSPSLSPYRSIQCEIETPNHWQLDPEKDLGVSFRQKSQEYAG